jgi:DNA-binding PadR family transcriptional regulator
MAAKPSDLVQGTLDMLILKTLALGTAARLWNRPAHPADQPWRFPDQRGLAVSRIPPPSAQGMIKADWRATENRRAKYYILTEAGRKNVKHETRERETQAAAIARIHGFNGRTLMRRMRSLLAGFRSLFRQARDEQELHEELSSYLEASAAEKARAGMSEEQAPRAARLELGSIEAIREEVRLGECARGLLARLPLSRPRAAQERRIQPGGRAHPGAGDWRQRSAV